MRDELKRGYHVLLMLSAIWLTVVLVESVSGILLVGLGNDPQNLQLDGFFTAVFWGILPLFVLLALSYIVRGKFK